MIDKMRAKFSYAKIIPIAFAGLILISGCYTASSSNSKKPQTTSESHINSVVPEAIPKPMAELPGGGNTIFPSRRLVALYGSPGDKGLGALGEQPADAAITRLKSLVDEYQPFSAEPIIPAFEIIATIAHSGATPNNDYSREVDIATIEPWVKAAKSAGIYVILDLQPGRADFLTQAKLYETLLKEPIVGLALDPEWRLKPNHFHLVNSGSVDAAEVNAVSEWLANLTKDNNLPQKLFLLHQFKLKMLPDRHNINTSRPELAYAIQMDGQGSQGAKLETWRTIMREPPANTFFGWKNFYKKDLTLLSPEATMKISPTPWYISYQ